MCPSLSFPESVRDCTLQLAVIVLYSCFLLSFLSPPLTPSFISSFTNWYFLRMPRLVILSYCMLLKHSSLGMFTRMHFCFPLNLLDFCVSHRHIWKYLETLDSSKPPFSGHPGLLTAHAQVFIGRLLIFRLLSSQFLTQNDSNYLEFGWFKPVVSFSAIIKSFNLMLS